MPACTGLSNSANVAGLDSVLREAVDSGAIPGVVAMATNGDGPIYQAAFGANQVAGEVPMSLDSIFRIASMTKAVTSVAVMQLVEDGLVELDAPASEYLAGLAELQVLDGFDADGQPILRPPAGPVTVRHLLTHTSGFVYEIWNEDLLRYMQVKSLSSISVDGDGFLAAPLLFDPGERWEYGISTDILGVLVERVSGQTLDVYFEENILAPLGMVDTGFMLSEGKQARLVNVHVRQEDGSLVEGARRPMTRPNFLSGGGGLVSTAGDYLRFLRMFLNDGELDGVRILQAGTVAMMGENQIGELEVGPARSFNAALSNDFDFFPDSVDRFGLGFLLNGDPVPGGRAVGSLAWAGLYNCYYWIDREKGVAAVLLTQILPFADEKVLELFDKFERAVYSDL
jgi:CubicO group peptidase (beta-lactamase class C family)